MFTTHEGTPQCQFEWFLCLISKSSTVTGGVASTEDLKLEAFQVESSVGTISSKIARAERSKLTN